MSRRSRLSILAGLLLVFMSAALAFTVRAGPTPAQAQPAGARRAQQLREEHLRLKTRHNGVEYDVRLTIVMNDDGSGDHPRRAAEAKARLKDRFPGAVEVQEQTLENSSQAYTLSGYWWPQHTTSWAYNPAGKPGYLSGDATAISGAAAAWNNAGGADWRFSGGGGSSVGTGACHNSLDGLNTVGWYPQSTSNVLAVTCAWYQQDGTPGTAVEFDMEIDPDWTWTTSTSGVQIDLQSVVAHEFGHALGLDHTSTNCPGSLMCPSYSPGTILRTPQADDINGLIALYGRSTSATPTPTPTPTSTATAKAELTSPPPGSTLPGSTVTFQWTAGSGAQEYWLWVGTTPGGYNLYTASQGLNRSVTISGLPTNGVPIYVRLWTKLNGSWQYNDYQYTAASAATATPTPSPTATATATPSPTATASAKAEMTSPPPGSTLPGSTVTFQWSAGSGVQEYWLWIGTSPGGYNLYTASQGLNRSVTVTSLPTTGIAIYVRLWSKIAGSWQYNDYQYTAASAGGATATPTVTATATASATPTPTSTASASAKAEMTDPPPGSVLPGSTVTFQWTAGSGAQEYWLWIGTTSGGYNLYTASQGLNRSVTISGLPTNGLPVYVRLWTKLNGSWQYNDYQYTAATGGQ